MALGFTRFAYALLLPPMHQELHWSYAQAGSMNTANALGYLLGVGARVEHAKNLLETGDQPLDVVVRRSGFGSPETLRPAFLLELGVPPAAYRARFRTTGASHRLA
ncbi:YbfB/YjiJ family MFS transporter [Nonomuraea polychroma]|uniref:YbfB/YjiJ family MFS transporter n=1 Tax=Nonomuraea polychroma TaxID=46176 RepID=UPI003D8D36FE